MDKIYSIEEIKDTLNKHYNYLSQKYNVYNFLLFGSYAKNKQNKNSDIDLLVNFNHPIDMFDFMDLEEYLSKIFNKKIDLGTINSLKPFIKNTILQEAIEL